MYYRLDVQIRKVNCLGEDRRITIRPHFGSDIRPDACSLSLIGIIHGPIFYRIRPHSDITSVAFWGSIRPHWDDTLIRICGGPKQAYLGTYMIAIELRPL